MGFPETFLQHEQNEDNFLEHAYARLSGKCDVSWCSLLFLWGYFRSASSVVTRIPYLMKQVPSLERKQLDSKRLWFRSQLRDNELQQMQALDQAACEKLPSSPKRVQEILYATGRQNLRTDCVA